MAPDPVYQYFVQQVEKDPDYLKWNTSEHKDVLINERLDLYKDNPKFRSKINRLLNTKKSYIYLTLSPDKFLRNLPVNDENISNLHQWCKKWFDCDKQYYRDYAWVIESGSNNDHLHVHAVCEMKNSLKHAFRLKAFWKKYFPNNQLLISNKKSGNEYHSLRFDTEEILQDKLEYFENEKKGTHENLVDLGLRGSRGFLTDI